MGRYHHILILMLCLALAGCGGDAPEQVTAAKGVAGCGCGYEIKQPIRQVKDRLASLEAVLLKAIKEVESASNQNDAKAILVEVYTDLSWLRYVAGNTKGANEAGRLAIEHDRVDVDVLEALLHQTVDMQDELLAAAHKHLDPQRGTRPAGLWSSDYKSLSDADADRMSEWCQIAGLYAALGDEAAVKEWTKDFSESYRVSDYFRSLSNLKIAEGYLLAGELDKGLAILKKRDSVFARPGQREEPEVKNESGPEPEPPKFDANAPWSPPLITSLGVRYAKALRCTGKQKESRAVLDSMHDLRALNPSDLLQLASEWGCHGEEDKKQQALLRYLDEMDLLVIQAGDDQAFTRFFSDSFLILNVYGFKREALETAQQFMLLPVDDERPQARVVQHMLLGMSHYFLGEVELADQAFEQVLTTQGDLLLPEMEPPPYAITQSAMRLRETTGPQAFDPIVLDAEAHETSADHRLFAARSATSLSGVTIDAATIEQWSGLPSDIRCGALLGQMHLALRNDGKSVDRAVGRTPRVE